MKRSRKKWLITISKFLKNVYMYIKMAITEFKNTRDINLRDDIFIIHIKCYHKLIHK